MRLPFLQIESDLLGHGAPAVATLAGCSPVQAVGHVAMLRAWVVSQGSDENPPDGWVYGPDAGALIEGAAQWTGEAGRLLRALRVAKLVVQDGESYQVVGMEPYQKAWMENQKARARMANKRVRSTNTVARSDKFGERSANTSEPSANFGRAEGERSAKFGGQTQTQTQNVEDPPKVPQGAGRAKPSNFGLHERLSEVHMRHRGSVLAFDGRLGDAQHRALLNLAQGGGASGPGAEDEVVRRFDHMLQRQDQPYEPGKHKGTTLAELIRPECWGANAKPPARRASGAQAPTMSQHNWDTLPPVHVPASDASEPY